AEGHEAAAGALLRHDGAPGHHEVPVAPAAGHHRRVADRVSHRSQPFSFGTITRRGAAAGGGPPAAAAGSRTRSIGTWASTCRESAARASVAWSSAAVRAGNA